MTKTLTLKPEAYTNVSMNDFYCNICKQLGEDPDKYSFNCTKIIVSEDIQNAIFDYYGNGEDAAMIWLCYGPKCDTELAENTVILYEKFLVLNE